MKPTSNQNLAKQFYVVVGRATHVPLAQIMGEAFPNRAIIYGAGGQTSLIDESIMATLRYLYPLARETKSSLVVLASGGIVVRALGPLLADTDKFSAPPILFLASDGRSLIPLLGEHHGGQRLGLELAEKLPLTYIGDPQPQPDDIDDGHFMAGQEYLPAWLAQKKPIATHWHQPPPATPQIIPPVLSVGVGLERGASAEAVITAVTESLEKINAHPKAVANFASIDIKMDEPALQALVETWGVPVRFFTAAELAAVGVPNPSPLVAKETGTPSVAEAASLLAAGYDHHGAPAAPLVLAKQKSKSVTVAISLMAPEEAITQNPLPKGFTSGQLAVVGVGPGDRALRTPLADHYLLSASDIVGYGLYLDLIADITAGKTLHQKNLGEEQARVDLALDLALQGKKVVLLASGDPGIYALASLAWQSIASRKETLAQKKLITGEERKLAALPVVIVPGVSAFQALAAKLGAPAGNDFAVISLSDLMTPRATILQRVAGALQGDFPIFLYNPKSQKRVDILMEVIARARQHRPPDTLVAIGKNLYRPQETIITRNLSNFAVEEVDMFSCVLIGNSTMEHFTHGGRAIVYAPRGYKK